ncbi:phage integrase family protein [Rhizobium sp. PP-CC-2G-626]|nr:phage integrase family protein [Rhizobium sp. PP-CC-2G-626]
MCGYLKGMKRGPAHPYPFVIPTQPADSNAVPTFPARHFGSFLRDGFVDRHGFHNHTPELLAHLIFGLGLRESESFHLFVTDVQFINNVPWIFFHHPQHGKVRDSFNTIITRQEYLKIFGMLPRNIDEGRNKAGWKGMSGDAEGTPGFWLPIDPVRNRAARLLKHYIFVIRPAIMASRPRSLPHHPFLLVNSRRSESSGWGDVGDPYTIEALEGCWERAARKIGKRFNDPIMAEMSKPHGNTPHRARHFYGRFLLNAGVEGPTIQSCMHQRSLESHLIYTRHTPAEINAILQGTQTGSKSQKPYSDIRAAFMAQFEHTPTATL